MFFNSFFRYFLYLTGTKFILAPNTIIFDKRRLVKTPGYEILITDIDDVIFFEKDAYMYMTITRGQQKYTYMICDLYRKQEDYVEE